MTGIGATARFRRLAIADLLNDEDIAASELARRIGVSRQVVSAYRAGATAPRFSTVLRMSEAFNKPLDYFIERDDGGTDEHE